MSFEWAENNIPDSLDALRAVARWARDEALKDAEKVLMAAGDARSKKATDEQARGRELAREHGGEHELRQSQLAHDHAWALRNQADGLWEAAAELRRARSGKDENQ